MTKKIALIIIATTVLVGCAKLQNTPVDKNQLEVSSPNTSINTESSGDVDQDLEEIETTINSLDVDEDFPTFDETNI